MRPWSVWLSINGHCSLRMKSFTSSIASSIITVRVVKVAIISTKQGSRAMSGMMRRSSEIDVFELMTTKALAMASPVALATVLLTASSGHRPSSCAQAGLFSMTARPKSLGIGSLAACLLPGISAQGLRLGGHGTQGFVGNGRTADIVEA